MTDLAALRREYGDTPIDITTLHPHPIAAFQQWLDDAVSLKEVDPSAFVLSTVTSLNEPDARVVLLKDIWADGIVFFTNYDSKKGVQLSQNNSAAATFYWPLAVRQVRLRGMIEKVADDISNKYFASRPYLSQVAASISPQSQLIEDRQDLLSRFNQTAAEQKAITRPENWGGYLLMVKEVEFFQGMNNRLNDRVLYKLKDQYWKISRLAP